MRKKPLVLAIAFILLALLVFPPIALSAGRGGGGGGGGRGGGGHHGGGGGRMGGGGGHGFRGGGHGSGSHAGWRGGGGHFGGHRGSFHRGGHRGFGNNFHHRGRFFGFGAFASPFVSWGWPNYWPYGFPGYGWPGYGYNDPFDYPSGPTMYRGNPFAYASNYPPAAPSPAPTIYSVNVYNPTPAPTPPPVAPAVYDAPPASFGSYAPAPQGVVEYPGGRYELRGDGMTVAYRWVWIPNPPSGPPGSAPTAGPPAAELAPARRGTIYHWTDTDGVMHVTDRWEMVPQRYRQQAKQRLAS